MADILISDLGAMAEAVHKDNDMLALQNVSSGETVKVSTQQLLDTVSSLTAMTDAVATTDVLVIHDTSAGVTKKVTPQQLFDIVPSLVIKGRDGGDIGGYLMDGVNDYITVPDDANLDFGLNDFSIELFVRLADFTPSAEKVLLEKHASNLGYKLLLTTAGKLKLQVGNGTDFTTFSYESDATGATDDSWAQFLITADRDGNALFYVNGILNKTVGISGSVAQTLDNTGALNIFGNGTSYTAGRVAIVRAYNRVLTSTEIASIYNNGRPDLYELPMSLRGASNTSIAVNGSAEGTYSSGLAPNWGTAGTITKTEETGRSGSAQGFTSSVSVSGGNIRCNTTGYKIGQIVYIEFYYKKISGSGDKFYILNRLTGTAVQIANVTTDWQKYSTTVTVTNTGSEGLFFGMDLDQIDGSVYAIDDVVFTKFGCVAEYLPRNAGSLGWIESSGNQLSGSTSGSPICLNKENRPPHYRDIRKAIAANTDTTLTSIVPKGYKIVSIRAKGSDSLADIKIGSASAGEQIVAATTTSSTTPKLLTLAATANDAYSESADVTLYARHDTSASGKTMDLIFHFEKVGN